MKIGNGKQGTENRERRTENGEQGTGNKEQETWKKKIGFKSTAVSRMTL